MSLTQAVADAEAAWARAGGTAGVMPPSRRHELIAAAVLRAFADSRAPIRHSYGDTFEPIRVEQIREIADRVDGGGSSGE